MAFNFLDLFPDTPGAVAGAQAAQDIIKNQYNGAMGFLEMENALMKTKQAQEAQARSEELRPLQQTVDAIKLLQGLNIQNDPGKNVFSEVNPMDLSSINDAIIKSVPNLKTDFEAALLKSEASARESTARANLLEGGRNFRANQEDERRNRADANKLFADLNDDPRVKGALSRLSRAKTPEDREKIASKVRNYVNASIATIDVLHPATAMAARKSLSSLITPAQAEQKKSAPKPYTSKSGKKYLLTPEGPKRIE